MKGWTNRIILTFSPYDVEIRISPLSEDDCQRIMSYCGRKIDTLDSLPKGSFPEELFGLA